MTLLWPPNRAGHYFSAVVSSFFLLLFSSPILSGRRLDVYHTSTHDVALVRNWNTSLKCAARGSLKNTGRRIREKYAVCAPSYNFAMKACINNQRKTR